MNEPTNEPTDEPTEVPGQRPITTAVLRHANRVHKFLRAIEQADSAERLSREAGRWNETSLTAVVAGDIKRGKSSLLNALVGTPSLLPVDADVATSVHLVIRYGEQLGVSVTRTDDEGRVTTTAVDPRSLVDYASMQGDESMRRDVTNVDVTVNHPLLERGLTLIDTPGVGGMSRGHRDITMSALQRADVLLFTISAQEPISRSEIEFLAEASERIQYVVFVVTKADLNPDDRNAQLSAENHAKLVTYRQQLERAATAGDERARELTQRFDSLLRAPYLLTSSLLADQAQLRAAAGRIEQAQKFRARSGLDRLEAMLDRSIARREDVRLANVVQVMLVALNEAVAVTQARVRAADGDASIQIEIAAKRSAMEALASKQARWRGGLQNNIQRMQTTLNRTVTKELGLVRTHYREIFEATTDVEALHLVMNEELDRSLRAAWNNLAATANTELQGVLAEVVRDLGVEGVSLMLDDLAMPDDLLEGINRTRSDTHEFSMLDDGVPLATQTFSFANMANAAGGMLGVASGGLGLAAYGIGAGISYALTRSRKQHRDRSRTLQEYSRMLNDALFGQEGIAKEFQAELSLRIIDAREQIEELVEARLGQRRRDLERESKELQQLLRGELAARQQQKVQGQRMLTEMSGLRGDAEKLRDQLRSPPPRPVVSGA